MRQALLAAALTLASTGALAQNVTLYGIVGTGIEYLNHADVQGNSVVRMPNSTAGLVPSRWGMRGTEDLGNGLKAVFNLESGLGLDTGMSGQGNRLFGRAAWVGLSSDWGTVLLGRQSNMTFFATVDSDTIGPAVFGLASLDPYMSATRSDNAISYRGTFSGWTAGATYSTGRSVVASGGPAATGCAGEVPGDSKACRQVTAMLKYDFGPGGIVAGYDQMRGGPGSLDGLTNSDNSDTRMIANGYYRIGSLKVGGGWIGRISRAAISRNEYNLFYLGANYAFSTALSLDTQVGRLNNKTTDARSTIATARLVYALSKRTSVYGQVGYLDNNSNAAVTLSSGQSYAVAKGVNQVGTIFGMQHTF